MRVRKSVARQRAGPRDSGSGCTGILSGSGSAGVKLKEGMSIAGCTVESMALSSETISCGVTLVAFMPESTNESVRDLSGMSERVVPSLRGSFTTSKAVRTSSKRSPIAVLPT